MRLQRLLASALAGCCILIAPMGAAMASCDDGFIYEESFDGDLRVGSEVSSCTIIGSNVAGSIIVTNVRNVVILNNTVGDTIRVDGNAKTGDATVAFNTVLKGNLAVVEMETASVVENETLTGDIKVNRNISAFVQKNLARNNLQCDENTSESFFFNFAKDGSNSCSVLE
jgi:hypothetical protein